jgi:hypothetical protein
MTTIILRKHEDDCFAFANFKKEMGSPWRNTMRREFVRHPGTRRTPTVFGDSIWYIYICQDPLCKASIAVLEESIISIIPSN